MGWSNYPENWEKDAEEIDILPEDHIVKNMILNQKYHISWASNRAMVWVLKGWNSTYAFLETPKSKKQLTCKIQDLRELNKQVFRNAKQRIKQIKQNGNKI